MDLLKKFNDCRNEWLCTKESQAMKTARSFFVILGLFYFVQSQKTTVDDKGCIWTYKCCEFKEVDGAVTCIRLCEPQINCETTETPEEDQNQQEVVEETFAIAPASLSFSMNANHICREGFRLNSKGKCRKVFGETFEKTTEASRKWNPQFY